MLVLLWPVLFVPLLGYAVEATRAGTAPPPPLRVSRRMLRDGFWVAVMLALSLLPFALLLNPLAALLNAVSPNSLVAFAAAFFALLLPWGLLALLTLPHATATFASTERARDLFDVIGALRAVARDFGTWNAVVAAMVTAWAIALACAGLLCVGIVPGIFYAILVSAHAAASLRAEEPGQGPSAR